jgi:elongation factor Ts
MRFLALAFDGITIGEKLIEQTGVIGEKIEISKYALIKGALVAPYVHGANRMGVLVQLNKSAEGAFEAAKDVAMQVAAMNPLAVDENNVSAETIAREKNIIIDTMKADPKMADKPAEMLDKIAGGKLSAFFKENTLLNQQFVKDNSKTVSQYLKEFDKDLTVLSFEKNYIRQIIKLVHKKSGIKIFRFFYVQALFYFTSTHFCLRSCYL